jgi:hypothetical protein
VRAPASGSTFAIGDTTVVCNAHDSAGNPASPKSFVVHVESATEQLADLHGTIDGLGLDQGLGKKLQEDVSKVEEQLANGGKLTCNRLEQLLKDASDQAGGHGLSYSEAIALLSAANRIGAVLPCATATPPNPVVEADLVQLRATIDAMDLPAGEANDLLAQGAALSTVAGISAELGC